MKLISAVFVATLASLALSLPAAAQICEDGQVLKPGDACVIDVRWGHDHFVIAEIPSDGSGAIEISHAEGKCNVALFGPIEGILGPEEPPQRSTLPGEYHLFTRAITLAQENCRYQVTVD
jgi:hypothetical protein